MNGVIITVPHSLCFKTRSDDDSHTCDYAAESSARIIFDNLKTPDKYIVLNNIPRYECDMNRFESRKTNFRKEIRRKFKEANYLFDIHSFPEMKKEPFINDVYVIDDTNPPTKLSHNLVDYLIDSGYRCKLYNGSGVNDITNEAKENGLQAVLIEISEDLSYNIRVKLCKQISSFINMRLKSRHKLLRI